MTARWTVLAWACVATSATTGARAQPPPAAPDRFAVVVGNNRGPPDLPLLRYADDDAARLHELLTAAGYTTRLLSVLDEETQALMPSVVGVSRPPTRAGLAAALAELEGAMAQSHAAGRPVELLFAFAGHGRGSASGGGSIFLLDGALTRAELVDAVVKPSVADFVHVVVDACDSYFMVASRGGAEPYPDDRVDPEAAAAAQDAVRSYLAGDGLLQDPRVGFLVSTTLEAESHEYDGFRAGVFSHVVRSAVAGAADANGDGYVEYSEVLAYAAAASQEIRDPRARLAIFGRPPPRDVHRPIMDLRHGSFAHFLRLGPDTRGRIHLDDARGVRYADLHKPAGSQVYLALVDSPSYLAVGEQGETRVRLSSRARGAVSLPPWSPPPKVARGVEGSALRNELFAVPYDASFYRGYVSSRGMTAAVSRGLFVPVGASSATFIPPRPRFVFAAPGLVAVAAGGALGVGAGVTTLLTKFAYDTYVEELKSRGTPDERYAQSINALRLATGLLVAGGMGAMALGIILVAVELLWPVRSREETP